MIERFSASVAARHMACHGSADLESAIPGFVFPDRDENMGAKASGKNIHKVIEDLINSTTVTKSRTTKFNARDMIDVGRTLSYIGEIWSRRRFTVLSEHTVTADWLTKKPKTTADLVFFTKDELHVIDVKWGKILVEAINNEQLLYYGASYAQFAPKAKEVHLHIVQPKADNMEEWVVSATELGKFIADAQAAEQAIQNGDVTLTPSDHCTFCPANPHSRGDKGHPLCPAMMQMLYPRQINEDEILSL